VCDKAAGVCVACLTDQDCPENDSCKAHACQPPAPACASAKDCSSVNGVCDKASGVCVDCLGDDDCVADRFCLESVCVPDQCPAGVAACADLVTRKTCSGNGGQWAIESCVDGDACESGACKPVVCTPVNSALKLIHLIALKLIHPGRGQAFACAKAWPPISPCTGAYGGRARLTLPSSAYACGMTSLSS
jgi:hypothetical protein